MESSLNRAIKAVVVLVLLCQAAAGQLVMAGVASDGSVDKWVLSTSLAQLGYPAGVVFADNTLPQRYSLLFPLPRDVTPRAATFHLYYRATPPLPAGAKLVLSINDKPAGELAVVTDGAPHEWVLPISRSELQAGQLKLVLEGAFPFSAEPCSGGLAQSGRLRVLSTTYLQSNTREQPFTLRDLWLTLPPEVKLSLPAGELDEALFSAAVEWLALLRRHNRSVRLVRLPELGDVVFSSRAGLESLLAAQAEVGVSTEGLWNGEGNVGVIAHGSRRFIGVTTPYPSAEQFGLEWSGLTLGARLDERRQHTARSDYAALSTFDITSEQAPFRGKVQWHGTITPAKLPPGTQPVSAHIDMHLPRLEDGETLRYYVYLNDQLVASELLDVESEKYQVNVPFKALREDNTYRLRIAMRTRNEGGCDAVAMNHRVGVGEASYLVVERDRRAAAQFSALPTAYGHGFDLILPQVALSRGEHYLPLLAELLNGFADSSFDYRMVFYSETGAIAPSRNFLLLGSEIPQRMKVPVQLQRGGVELVDRKGNVLLDDEHIRKLTVIQVARYLNHSGLLVTLGTENGLPNIDVGQLGSADVAFYSSAQKVLSIDMHQSGMTYIRYLDAPYWFERMYKERWGWLLAFWSLLTLVIIYLYIKSKQHRRVRLGQNQ